MSNFFHFFKQIPRPLFWAAFSGILVGTSYIPFPGWALFFCYIPLWLCLLQLLKDHTSLKKIFFTGWITQFILTLIGFNWIYYVSAEFGHLPWALSLAALLLFASAMHIYIPLSLTFACWIIRRRNISNISLQVLLFALSQSLFERIWPSIFEWNLGYALLWMRLPLFQWADTVGFWGLSTWILLIQAGLCISLLFWKAKKQSQALKIFFTLLILVLSLTALGVVKEKKWSATTASIQFAVVQGNIGNAEKVLSEKKDQFQAYIFQVYADLTEQHLKKNPQTEIVLWPETAMPFALDVDFHQRYLQNALLKKVSAWNVTLLTGGYSQSVTRRDHLGYPLTRNSVFFIGPQLKLQAEPYNKTALLVFGEYMPFGEEFPFLYQLLPFVGVYERGPGPHPERLQLAGEKSITVGPQICYESLDSAFARGLAEKGADLIFNVTNDSWFGWWAEPYQNNIMSLARAIEVRRPLVRSTNTGISSVILANGKILENSPIDQTWAHTYEINYLKQAPQTFFTRWGHWDWVIWTLVFIFLLIKGKYVRD